MDKITREEALKRWESAKKQKKNMVRECVKCFMKNIKQEQEKNLYHSMC